MDLVETKTTWSNGTVEAKIDVPVEEQA